MSESTPKQPPYSLLDVLKEQTRDLYDAEREYSAFLSDLTRAARDDNMREIISGIATDNMKNISDLEAVCELLGVEPTGVKCEAMAGLLREGKETTQEYESSAVRDAALIANAQRIAHYEIAGFGTARAFADQLDHSEIASLFKDTLARANSNDRALTKLATGSWLSAGINREAAGKD